MSAELVVLVVVLALLLAAGLLAAYLTAHRLDRLHIRTDLARASLQGSLERRHAVAVAVAREVSACDAGTAARIGEAVAHARAHPPHAVVGTDPAHAPDRRRWEALAADRDGDAEPGAELSENALGLVLAEVDTTLLPPDLAAELDDAADRVSMARRFYNDAVRDTRALRERPTVRMLRLAGHAAMPDFVELVDPPTPGT